MGRKKQAKRDRERASRIERADLAVVDGIAPWLDHPVARAVGAVGSIGDEPPLLALGGGLLAVGALGRNPRLARAAVRMLAAHTLTIVAKTLVKNRVDRTRPHERAETGRYSMKRGRSHEGPLRSFPSGHTGGAVAVARAFSREYPEHGPAAMGAAGLIGALQVPRRAHFPTDVLAGAIIGLAAEAISSRLLRHAGLEPASRFFEVGKKRDPGSSPG